MSARFEKDGIQFQYPESWQVEQSQSDEGWTVNVQSPQTAFALISIDHTMPSVEHMLETVLETMRSDYQDLEEQKISESLGGQKADGFDIRFACLDLTNTCCVRSFQNGEATLLVLWQAADLDLDETEPVLKAIVASIRID